MANESFFEPLRLARQLTTTSTLPAVSGPLALVSVLGVHTSAWTTVAPSNLGSPAATAASRTTAVVA